ncbi:MAG: hypothetical protein ABIJ44_07420, partial [Pseudomonadota bacterium]
MDKENKIMETQVSHIMELLKESLLIYEEILSGISEFEPEKMACVSQKIRLLKKETENHEKAQAQQISSADISLSKKVSSIQESVTDDKEIKDKRDLVISSLSSGSRYGYLLNNKIVTSDQLQKALAISKKTKKSVEFVLIDHFKVRKEEVGKSLSLFHDCPFKSFDPDVPIPVELIRNL